MAKIKVVVNGAAGRMGREVVKAVTAQPDMNLVGVVDIEQVGKDAGILAGIGNLHLEIANNLAWVIKATKAQVVVDFTRADAAVESVKTILKLGARAVVGTTGMGEAQLKEIRPLCEKLKLGAIICPNFAVGAVVLMKLTEEVAPHFSKAEIIELHHDQKRDAPSGTAVATALRIIQARSKSARKEESKAVPEIENVKGVRGGKVGDIHIHSVRLPGLVAHQEVIFGGLAQTLTIRHDTVSRESFMPGVLMAIRKVKAIRGLVFGLESLL